MPVSLRKVAILRRIKDSSIKDTQAAQAARLARTEFLFNLKVPEKHTACINSALRASKDAELAKREQVSKESHTRYGSNVDAALVKSFREAADLNLNRDLENIKLHGA